jgi:hypothetical protein
VDQANDPFRLKISAAQVELLREVLADGSPSVIDTGERIARGEVVQRADAMAVADVLSEAFNAEDIYEDGPTPRGKEIDVLVSIAMQASHDFYD